MLYPPALWTNGPVRLYHGTVETHARAIVAAGVSVVRGRTGTDFGPGFYTTTLERQAKTWAYQLARRNRGARAAVVAVDVDREVLASLETLAFVRGDFDAEDYWSLVVHCRTGAIHHGRKRSSRLYDVVVGPVASFWQQRLLIQGVDQASFHTPAAESVLNSSKRFVSWVSNP
jgi:hypothetical protein